MNIYLPIIKLYVSSFTDDIIRFSSNEKEAYVFMYRDSAMRLIKKFKLVDYEIIKK